MATQYATRADLAALALNASALTAIPNATQDAALLAASEVADSYLRAQFMLPLVSFGNDLRRAVALVAAYDLMVTRGYNPDAGADATIRLRYEDALAWLRDAAKGVVAPDVVDSSAGGIAGDSALAGPRVATSSQRGYSTRGGQPGGSFTGD